MHMEDQILRWSSHPIKNKKKGAIFLVLVMILFWVLVWFSTGSILFLVISVIILSGALSSFFLPTEYELTPGKIKVKFFLTNKEKTWEDYKSFYIDRNGVLLSPFDKPSRLENFRGIYLRFDKNKEEVIKFISSKLGK
jgi:hypothetical protein